MAKATFKKKDKQRFRKVYPYIRKKPVWELCSDKEVEIEVGSIVFSGTDTGTYTFSTSFISVPVITSIAVDSSSTGTADVNVYVSSVTTTEVVLKTSATFTGTVDFHAIRIGS
jgi:hypothetical protein